MNLNVFFIGLTLSLISFSSFATSDTHFEGHYERYDNGELDTNSSFIDLMKLNSNTYQLSGESVWVGHSASGLVNFGEIDGIVNLKGNQIDYDIGGCSFQIRLHQDKLVVRNDNGGCGGLNVYFNGTYLKASKH